VVTFGSNAEKQMGLAPDHPSFASPERHTPVVVRAFSSPMATGALSAGTVTSIAAGGSVTLCALSPGDSVLHLPRPYAPLADFCHSLVSSAMADGSSPGALSTIFSHASTLSALFYKSPPTAGPGRLGPSPIPVDYDGIRACFAGLYKLGEKSPAAASLRTATVALSNSLAGLHFSDPQDFIAVIVLLENPLLLSPRHCLPVLEKFSSFLLGALQGEHAPLFDVTFHEMSVPYFSRAISLLVGYLGFILSEKGTAFEPIHLTIMVLDRLYHINETRAASIPAASFICAAFDSYEVTLKAGGRYTTIMINNVVVFFFFEEPLQ
jgi:hypothetical protein